MQWAVSCELWAEMSWRAAWQYILHHCIHCIVLHATVYYMLLYYWVLYALSIMTAVFSCWWSLGCWALHSHCCRSMYSVVQYTVACSSTVYSSMQFTTGGCANDQSWVCSMCSHAAVYTVHCTTSVFWRAMGRGDHILFSTSRVDIAGIPT